MTFPSTVHPTCEVVVFHLYAGGYSEEALPGPIPNPVVKLLSADGTARATVWESRSPPAPLKPKPPFR